MAEKDFNDALVKLAATISGMVGYIEEQIVVTIEVLLKIIRINVILQFPIPNLFRDYRMNLFSILLGY